MRTGSFCVVLASTMPAVAAAADFGPRGELVFDDSAVVTLDFEDPEAMTGEAIVVEDEGALSGGRVLQLAAFTGVDLPLELPDTATEYRVSAWIMGGEAVLDVEVLYADNAHPGVDELGVLYPTGRMTSDGWIEVANDHVRVDGERGATVTVGFFAPTGARVDAVELVPLRSLPAAERSGEACDGSIDDACGPSEVCLFSQCRYVGGAVPDLPTQDRALVSEYLSNRLRLLFGPLLNRRLDLPHAELALARLSSAERPWDYWNAFTLAIRRLHDGHTTTSGISDFVLDNERPLGLCFIEGDADLSLATAAKDEAYLDVLVSHTAPSRTLGMKRGDRLVRVDGLHPIAWARAQTEHHWGMSPTSNHVTFAELAEQLRGLVARYAHEIEIIRCDAANGACGSIEVVNLSQVAPIAPDEVFEGVQCDNRPLRHLATSPANHVGGFSSVFSGLVLGSNEAEGIYGAEWDSLSTTGNDGVGPALKAAVQLFRDEASGVILDHRTGNGGTILGPKILWDFSVQPRPVSVYQDRRFFDDEEPSLEVGLSLFQAGVDQNQADVAGSTSPTTMPVALLLTRDVSASDWLPLGMKGGGPNVKLFAPFQTNGGFSTRYGFGYWLGVSYVIAVGDTFDATGLTRNGRGVEPDVVVLPKQSDLVVDKDTVFEAALAWIREELAQ